MPDEIKRTEVPVHITGFPWCAKEITPSDDEDLTNHEGEVQAMTVRANTDGDVAVIPMSGQPSGGIVFTLKAGEWIPCLCKRVLAAGTTAGGLVGFF